MSTELPIGRGQFTKITSTGFWTLCYINFAFTGYGFIADLAGLSFFGKGSAPKYHMGPETAFVCAVIMGSFVMLLVLGMFVFGSSTKARWCILAASITFFSYLAIPHY